MCNISCVHLIVSMPLLEHRIQIGFGYKVGQKIFSTMVTHILGVPEF